MSSSTRYPRKDTDDDTVDSDSQEQEPLAVPVPTATTTSDTFTTKTRKRLTTISRAYDLDGSGELDDAEQAMRDRDTSGRGYLTNEEIYTIVQEQLQKQRTAGMMKKIIGALICFTVLLALSNLGTSIAAAVLAKDVQASNEKETGAVMRIKATGEIAGAQSTADTYEAEELTEGELEERRLVVLEDMAADPHSHAHRRQLFQCDNPMESDYNKKKCGGITHDVRKIKEQQVYEMQTQCAKQSNVYLKRNWAGDTRKDPLCGRGTSVIVKEKKKKNNKDKKKNKNNRKNKNRDGSDINVNCEMKDRDCNVKIGRKNKRPAREVIFEKDDGETVHITCDGDEDDGDYCYMGGAGIQGRKNDPCLVKSDECVGNLVCTYVEPKKIKNQNNKKQNDLRNSNGNKNNRNNDNGSNKSDPQDCSNTGRCKSNQTCLRNDRNGSFSCVKNNRNNNNNNNGGSTGVDCSDSRRCGNNQSCNKSRTNGSDRWYCTNNGNNNNNNNNFNDNRNNNNNNFNFNDNRNNINNNNNGGNTGGDCSNSRSCGNNQTCRKSPINGSDRWFCANNRNLRSYAPNPKKYGRCLDINLNNFDVVPKVQRNFGGRCAAGEQGSCSNGLYCRPDNFNENEVRRGGDGYGNYGNVGTAGYQRDALLIGPSGTVGGYNRGRNSGAGVIAPRAYDGVGKCQNTVGPGQTCYAPDDCGGGTNSCRGLNDFDGGDDAFELIGSSGTIIVPGTRGTGYQMTGICR